MRQALEDGGQTAFARQRKRSLKAPLKGWNTRDPIQAMAEGYAILMDNWIPRNYYAESRGGQAVHATTFGGSAVETLIAYNPATASNKLFASSGSKIYDVTSAGVASSVVTGLTNAQFVWTSMVNAGASYIIGVNGVDLGKKYDGTTWTDFATTGVTSNNFSYVTVFKSQVWLVKKASLSAYYLATDAVGGAATEFPLGPAFREGGYLVGIMSWAIDAGDGLEDYIVFLSSQGEIAVYSGTNPASDFVKVGVFRVPKPVGKNCLIKYGGDVMLLGEQGVYPLSKALQSSTISRAAAVTDAISPTFSTDIANSRSAYGWSMQLHSAKNLLLVNSPLGYNSAYPCQYVMNTITGAWARFVDINAKCMAVFNDDLYVGGTDNNGVICVSKVLTTKADYGNNITSSLITAYSTLNNDPSVKHVKMLRPQLGVTASITSGLALLADYDARYSWQTADITLGGGLSVWDTALWDSATWGFDEFNPNRYRTVFNDPASAVAVGLRVAQKGSTVKLSAFDLLYENGGVL